LIEYFKKFDMDKKGKISKITLLKALTESQDFKMILVQNLIISNLVKFLTIEPFVFTAKNRFQLMRKACLTINRTVSIFLTIRNICFPKKTFNAR
jgi:hypothetical protein